MCTATRAHTQVWAANETQWNNDTQLIVLLESVSITYSCAVTADSGRGRKKIKTYSDVCPPKSDTDAAKSFGVVTQAGGRGDDTPPWPNERVLKRL